jgi:hypothetical protein
VPGILVADLAVKYRAEAHRHDALLFETGFCDFNKYGADIITASADRPIRH